MSASGAETAKVCVQNLHMHTFPLAGPFRKEAAFRPRWAPALQSELVRRMWLWGVGDLLIT